MTHFVDYKICQVREHCSVTIMHILHLFCISPLLCSPLFIITFYIIFNARKKLCKCISGNLWATSLCIALFIRAVMFNICRVLNIIGPLVLSFKAVLQSDISCCHTLMLVFSLMTQEMISRTAQHNEALCPRRPSVKQHFLHCADVIEPKTGGLLFNKCASKKERETKVYS